MRARLQALLETLAALAVVVVLTLAALSTWQPIRVSGMSMYPALCPGDVVVVDRGRDPLEGDMVLLHLKGHNPVLHRVVRVSADGILTTRGDANPVEDREKAPSRSVKGVVVRVLPLGVLLERWRGVREVGYHDGSVAHNEAMTETTFSPS